MTTEKTTGGAEHPRDPECFEEWLLERLKEQPDRQDEIGRVARWVLKRMKPGHPARWTPEPVLLPRHGHGYDVPARYENYLRYVANLSEESIETFFRVFDLYLKDDNADYDRKVEECSRDLGEESGDEGNGDGETPTMRRGGAKEHYSWESWNLFWNQLLGPEQIGYDVDEDGWPIEDEFRDEGA